jgi:hypothetical protein
MKVQSEYSELFTPRGYSVAVRDYVEFDSKETDAAEVSAAINESEKSLRGLGTVRTKAREAGYEGFFWKHLISRKNAQRILADLSR